MQRHENGAHFEQINYGTSVKNTQRISHMDILEHSHSLDKRHLQQHMEFTLNVLNQMLIGFVTIYMSWLCLRQGLSGTAVHAWLTTIGFSLLMAEGIMCHYNGNVLTHGYKRNTKTTMHWILQSLGGGLGVVGILIKCFQKNFLLTSLHGKLGFSTLIICLVSMLCGLSALYSQRVKRVLSPQLNKAIHNLLGIITFVYALITQFYGYRTGFFIRKTSYDFQILIQCITLISLVLTCIGPLKALFNKIRRS